MVLVIPAVDVMNGSCVRLLRGAPSEKKIYGDPVRAALRFFEDGAEWLHLVDLDAAIGRGDNLELLLRIVEKVDIKVEVAGGIRSSSRARKLVETGASKVVLGTSAINNPSFISEVSHEIGSEKVSVALDVKGENAMIQGWTKHSGSKYIDVLKNLNHFPFHNFIVTCIEADGTLLGPNTRLIAESVTLSMKPVFAAGGVRSLNDINDLKKAGAQGVILGKALYEGRINLKEAFEVVK